VKIEMNWPPAVSISYLVSMMRLPGKVWLRRLRWSLAVLLFMCLLPLTLMFNLVLMLSIFLRKGGRGINREEASAIRGKQVERFQAMSYSEIAALLHEGEYSELLAEPGASGTMYQVTVDCGRWMSPANLIFVQIGVYDDGWSQYVPLSSVLAISEDEGWSDGTKGEITNASSGAPESDAH
jgi:hypothetical protein